jgi:hypothetical protein
MINMWFLKKARRLSSCGKSQNRIESQILLDTMIIDGIYLHLNQELVPIPLFYLKLIPLLIQIRTSHIFLLDISNKAR